MRKKLLLSLEVEGRFIKLTTEDYTKYFNDVEQVVVELKKWLKKFEKL